MAAGEITFTGDGGVEEVSNQSTGFCPEVECWPIVAQTLTAAGLQDPGGWTVSFEFRRCLNCGASSLIKEDVYECAECGHDLPDTWNFDRTIRAVVRLGDCDWVVDSIEEPGSTDQDRVSWCSSWQTARAEPREDAKPQCWSRKPQVRRGSHFSLGSTSNSPRAAGAKRRPWCFASLAKSIRTKRRIAPERPARPESRR